MLALYHAGGTAAGECFLYGSITGNEALCFKKFYGKEGDLTNFPNMSAVYPEVLQVMPVNIVV